MNTMDSDESLKVLLKAVVGACFEVSNVLGSGFLEKVHERALLAELRIRGVHAESQVPLKVHYKGEVVGDYFADILVEGKLIIELKCCDVLGDEIIAQCINYLAVTNKPVMLLVNFQNPRLEWRRIFPRQAADSHSVHSVHSG